MSCDWCHRISVVGHVTRDILNVMTHHLVGVHEIAEMLGVSRQRVDELSRTAAFPTPDATLRSGRIWRREDVEAWARETGRMK